MMKKIVDKLNFCMEKLTGSVPVMWAAARKKTRYSTAVSLSVLVHVVAFSAYFGVAQLKNKEVLELREITFVDLSRQKPASNTKGPGQKAVTSGKVIERKTPPAKKAETPKPTLPMDLERRMDKPPVADRIRTQAPISLAKHAAVQLAGTSGKDVLSVSSARGANNPDPVTALANPVNLAKKGRLQLTGLTRPASVVPDSKPSGPSISLKRTGMNLSTGGQSAPPSSIPNPITAKHELSPVRKSRVFISGPLGSRQILEKSIPAFPNWAKRKGVGATISLQFMVMEDGRVKENIIVVRTSGAKEWDDEVIAALRRWHFAPLRNAGRRDQSGIITFQFVID